MLRQNQSAFKALAVKMGAIVDMIKFRKEEQRQAAASLTSNSSASGGGAGGGGRARKAHTSNRVMLM